MRNIHDERPSGIPVPEADDPSAVSHRRRWPRRLAVVGVALIALGLLLSVPGLPGHPQAALTADLIASDAGAVAAVVNPFEHVGAADPCGSLGSQFEVGNNLFKNLHYGFYASIWPSYAALTAMSVASISSGRQACSRQVQAIIDSIDANYWDDSVPNGLPAAFSQGPAAFHVPSDLPRVDDSLWMGLVLMREYHSTHDPAFLDRARLVFILARRNWDQRGGGIYWEESGAGGKQRAVVSNAPAAILGLELFRVEHHHSDLAWSERIFGWLRDHLEDPSTGLFDDHLGDRHGRTLIDRTQYTYVQGVMIGLMALLSEVDPLRYPMSNAVSLSRRSMAYFERNHAYGQPAFDVILLENLLWTAALADDPSFCASARAAVSTAAGDEPPQRGDLLTQASERTLALLRELPPARYGDLLYVAPPHASRCRGNGSGA